MKKKWASLATMIALASICLVLALPVNAIASETNTGPQTWSLDSEPVGSASKMEKNWGPGDDGQSGQVLIASGGSHVWVADQAAAHDITFSGGAWVLQIVTDSDWGTAGSNCLIEIGEWNGSAFSSMTPPPQSIYTRARYTVIIKTLVQSSAITIHKNLYLAIRVTNLEPAGINHNIQTGEDVNNSYLRSPQTDVTYPLPELAAGLALALGLGGLAAFILVRCKATNTAMLK